MQSTPLRQINRELLDRFLKNHDIDPNAQD